MNSVASADIRGCMPLRAQRDRWVAMSLFMGHNSVRSIVSREHSHLTIGSMSRRGLKKMAINVFFSYSHADESLRDQVEKQLSMLKTRRSGHDVA